MNTLQRQRAYLMQADTILNPHRATNPREIDQAIHTLILRLLEETDLNEQSTSALLQLDTEITRTLSERITKPTQIMKEMAALLKPANFSEEETNRLYDLLNSTLNYETERLRIVQELTQIQISPSSLPQLETYQSWLNAQCLLERELEIASLNYLKAKEAAWILPPRDQEKELDKLDANYCQKRLEICSKETKAPQISPLLKNFAEKTRLFEDIQKKTINVLQEAEELLSKMPAENQDQFKILWAHLNVDTKQWKRFYNEFLLGISHLLGNINFRAPFIIEEDSRQVKATQPVGSSRTDDFVHVDHMSYYQIDSNHFQPIQQPKLELSEETRKTFSVVRILYAHIKKTKPHLQPLVDHLNKDEIDILLQNYTNYLMEKVKQPENFIDFVMNRDAAGLEKLLGEG